MSLSRLLALSGHRDQKGLNFYLFFLSFLSPSRKPCTYFKARGRKQQENIGDLKRKAVQRHGNAWPVQPFFVRAAVCGSLHTDRHCLYAAA